MSGETTRRDMRAEILAAATRLFADRGFAATSLQHIAEEVGVRKPSLLYWYPSKEELRLAVLDALLAHWKDTVPRILVASQSGKDRFSGALGELLAFFSDEPDRARLLLRAQLDVPDEMHQRLREHVAPWLGLVTDYVRRGQAEGRVRAGVDPEAWLVQVLTMAVTTFATLEMGGGLGMEEDEASLAERRTAELLRIARRSLFNDRPDRRA